MTLRTIFAEMQPADRRALAGALLAYSSGPNDAAAAALMTTAPPGSENELLALGAILHRYPTSQWATWLREIRDVPEVVAELSTVPPISRMRRVLSSVDDRRRRALILLVLRDVSGAEPAIRSLVGRDDADWLIGFRRRLGMSPSSGWSRTLRAVLPPDGAGWSEVPCAMPLRATPRELSRRGSPSISQGHPLPWVRAHLRLIVPPCVAALSAVIAILVVGFASQTGPTFLGIAAWHVAGALDQPAWVAQSVGMSTLDSATLTCPGVTTCFVTDPAPNPDSGAIIQATTNGGKSWRPVTLPSGLRLISRLSCPAVTHCVGVAVNTSSPLALAVSTTDGGNSWTTHALATAPTGRFDIACPTRRKCVVIGVGNVPTEEATSHNPIVATTSSGAITWTVKSLPTGLIPAFPDGMSCASQRACVVAGAVGEHHPNGSAMLVGSAQYTRDGGRRWLAATWPAGVGRILAVSCVSATLCLATANRQAHRLTASTVRTRSIVLVSHTGGKTWSRIFAKGFLLDHATALNCPTSTSCWVAGVDAKSPLEDQSALMLVTRDGGQSWSKVALPGGPKAFGFIPSLSCVPPRSCSGIAWTAKSTEQVVLRNHGRH